MTPPAHKIRIGTLQTIMWHNLGNRGNWNSVKLTDNLWNSVPVLLPATQMARLRPCR